MIAVVRRCTHSAVVIASVCALWALSAFGQDTASTDALVTDTQPQVQMLVLQLDYSGTANVALTYPGTESLDAAQKDIVEIGDRTGWQITNPILTNNPPSTPERPPMTSVEFTVPNAVPVSSSPQAGGFKIEPLILALKRFREIELVFAMRPEFRFKGLREYEDDHVRVQLRTAGQTYTYRIEIKRSDFDKLDLPVVVEPVTVTPHSRRGPGIIVPLIISICVGLAVWLLAYLVKKRRLDKETA